MSKVKIMMKKSNHLEKRIIKFLQKMDIKKHLSNSLKFGIKEI